MSDSIQKSGASFKAPLITYCSLWALYYVVILIKGELRGLTPILVNLLPFLFFAAIATGFYLLSRKLSGLRPRSIVIGLLIFVAIDQSAKWLIRSYAMPPAPVHLFLDWLYFYPVLNTRGSWFASWFDLKIWPHIFTIINFLFIPLIVQIYRFYRQKWGKSFWLDFAMIMIGAGSICSLVDKLFFAGSLDFFMLKGLFVADTKDFFLVFGIGSLITEFYNKDMLKGSAKTTFNKDLQLGKEFLAFTKQDLARLFRKKDSQEKP